MSCWGNEFISLTPRKMSMNDMFIACTLWRPCERRIAQRQLFLVDQRELDPPALAGNAGEEQFHLERGPAAEAQDADRPPKFAPGGLADLVRDDLHARLDALGDFKPDTMEQHPIGFVADAPPVIDLVHHFEVAGIAERLGVAAVPDRAVS